MTTQIAVRLPVELLDKIDALVTNRHGSRSEVVRRAIESYLYRTACEDDAARYEMRPLTDSELALADDPAGWGTTPAW